MNHSLSDYLRNFALTVCVFAATVALAESEPSAKTGPELVQQAYEFFESGQMDRALAGFNQALERDAANLPARLGQAMVLLKQQRYQDAFSSYDAIVQSYPAHSFAWNGRGLAAFNMENFDEALTSFQRATADHPVNGFFYESLAWTYLCQRDYSLAATTAKQSALMYQQNGETAAYPLLIAYFSQLEEGENEAARRTLYYALSNKPANNAWPTPVFEYLAGGLSAIDLISFVTDPAQETEAHTYIGLNLRAQGELKQADSHLNWVATKGDQRVFEHTLARSLQIAEKMALLTP